MKKIIIQSMEYLTNRFEDEHGVWRLSGTEYGSGYVASSAVDTFRNESTREFKEIIRIKVFDMQKNGLIKYIEPCYGVAMGLRLK